MSQMALDAPATRSQGDHKWDLDVRRDDALGIPGADPGIVAVNIMDGDARIAGVTVRPGRDVLATARLLRAAPELLKALEESVVYVRKLAEIVDVDPSKRALVAGASVVGRVADRMDIAIAGATGGLDG